MVHGSWCEFWRTFNSWSATNTKKEVRSIPQTWKWKQGSSWENRKKPETEKESEVSVTMKENKRPRIAKKPIEKPADKPHTGTVLKVTEIPPASTPQNLTPATTSTISIFSPTLLLQSSETPSSKPVRTRVFSCNIIIAIPDSTAKLMMPISP